MSMDNPSLDMEQDEGIRTTSNVGSGAGLALAVVDDDAPFKSIVAGTNVSIDVGANDITINATNADVSTWSTFPATQDVDFAGFDIDDVTQITVRNVGTGNDPIISSDDDNQTLCVVGRLGINTVNAANDFHVFSTGNRPVRIATSDDSQNGIVWQNATRNDFWQWVFDSVAGGLTGSWRVNHADSNTNFFDIMQLERTGTNTGIAQFGTSTDIVNLELYGNIDIQYATGIEIGTAVTQKLSFYGNTPITQPADTGETTGFTAGAGTGVNDDSTFTGNVGTKAYTISDIVKALKNLGLIATS